jgi:hypothetical protein
MGTHYGLSARIVNVQKTSSFSFSSSSSKNRLDYKDDNDDEDEIRSLRHLAFARFKVILPA